MIEQRRLAITLAAGLLVAPGWARAETRVAIIVSEIADGATRTPSELESALLEQLGAVAGIVLIEEGQLAALRTGNDEGGAALKDAVTAVDADLVLAGNAELDAVRSDLVPGLTGYHGRAALRLFATDSGQILGTVRVSAEAKGNIEAKAARSLAVDRLAEQAIAKIRERYPDALERTAPRRVAVRLRSETQLSTAEVQRALRTLRDLGSVRGVELVHRDERNVALSVTVDRGTSTFDVALDVESAGTALVAVGHSNREVVVKLDPRRGQKIAVRARTFGRSAEARLARDFVVDALLGLGFVTRAGARFNGGPVLELRGKVYSSEQGKRGLRIRAVHGRRTVASVQGSCDRRDFAGCAAALAGRLTHQVESARGELQAGSNVQSGLEVVALETPGVFPARLGHYTRHPFGAVVVRNVTDRALDGVVVRVRVARVADQPVDSAPITVAANQEVRIPVRAVFDPARLAAQTATGQRIASVEVRYRSGDFERIVRTNRPVIVYERNAMEWREDGGASIAGFIDGHASRVRAVADAVQARLEELDAFGEPFALAAAVTEALRPLRYARDPKSPFDPARLDFVRFADETLGGGRGDCDDLSVAFASVVEAAGGSAIFLLMPAHVLLAVGTGIPVDRRPAISVEDGATVVHDGQLYIPVEATRLAGGFAAAWEAAKVRLRTAPQPPVVIDLSAARVRYPAATIGRDPGPTTAPVLAADRVKTVLKRLAADREDQVRRRVDALMKVGSLSALGQAGTLLAQLGDFAAAHPLLERAAAPKGAAVRSLNNFGNVQLIRSRPEVALDLYERVLARSPTLRAVRMNAVIAAVIADASERLDAHLLELSPKELQQLWKRAQGGVLQPAEQRVPSATLARIRAILVARGVDRVDEDAKPASGAERVTWSQLLHWL